MSDSPPPLARAFGVGFRPYQLAQLDAFDGLVAKGDRFLHFIAPPGSGKTIVALEMVRRLGRPALILAPNQTIQGQWVAKLRGLSDEVSVSVDPTAGSTVLALTYQVLSVKESGGEGSTPRPRRWPTLPAGAIRCSSWTSAITSPRGGPRSSPTSSVPRPGS